LDEDLIEKLKTYASRHGRSVIGRLGFGIHGIVYAIEGNASPGFSAVKIHRGEDPYFRECDVYERLKEEGITEIRGFRVQLLAFDDELRALEMTVVKPPFVLDFAGAYLDFPPEFSDEIWEEWEDKNQEQFGGDWPTAQTILSELRDLGIHMHDPSPSNIRFR